MFTNYNCFLKGIIIIGFLVQFSTTSARTYFVSPDGNDNNPGTIELPWGTWGKAFNANLSPGDTVFFRGGTYIREFDGNPSWYNDYWNGYNCSLSGTKANPIVFINYEKEIPILDGTGTYIKGEQKNTGLILTSSSSNLHLIGLHIKSIEQVTTIQEDVAGLISEGSGIVLEQMTIYDIDGGAFKIGSRYADTTWVLNCDAYFACDSLGDQHEQPTNPRPGDDGTGFGFISVRDSNAVIISTGNRAWNCGDQGFSAGGIGTVIIDSCWSFENGMLDGGGHAFKVGWTRHSTKITNSLMVNNKGSGLTTNEDYLAAGGTVCAGSLIVWNNTIYNNGYGTRVDAYPDVCDNSSLNELNRVYYNNILYDNINGDFVPTHGAIYTHAYNSTDDPPGVTVSDSDFLLLTKDSETIISVLGAPRKADGSLPDIGDYFKLAGTSALIDAGKNVGLPYSGNAPDLGAREYTATKSNMRPSVNISSPANNTKSSSPANFDFTISAYDIDGTIDNVTLLMDGKTIGTKSSSPWSFNWYNVEAGTYNIVAVATDDKGETAYSPPVTLVVENPHDLISNTDILELYPNPNNGIFTLTYNDPSQSEYTNINISTIEGKSVYKGKMLKEEVTKQFNLSHISTGLYILVLSGQNIITTKKFIKH